MIYSGIYKWINPKGRVYVGQSEDLLDRQGHYKHPSWIKGQPRIYYSIMKYGIEAHTFEVIELCCIEKLDERERYWQEYYDVIGPMGMNCVLKEVGEKRRVYSEECKKRMSESQKKVVHSEDWYRKMKEYGEKRRGVKRPEGFGEKISEIKKSKNLKMPDHVKEALRIANISKKISEEEKERRILESINNKRPGGRRHWLGRKHTEESKKKMFLAQTGRKHTPEHIRKVHEVRKVKIIQYDRDMNFIKQWDSIKEASETLKIVRSTIGECCTGIRKTAGNFKWKYAEDVLIKETV